MHMTNSQGLVMFLKVLMFNGRLSFLVLRCQSIMVDNGAAIAGNLGWLSLMQLTDRLDWTGLNFKEIMEDVEKIKGTGNRLFKEGKFELAKGKYEKVLREFNHVNPQDEEEGKEFSNTRNLLHLNVAACYLKMGECRKSIEACNKVLDTNPVHVKALYRRGMAYLSAADFEEARNDFNKMISIDKSSEPNATAALIKVKQKEQVGWTVMNLTSPFRSFLNFVKCYCMIPDKQEVERKAWKQFKGLFDKKPGEIAEVGTDDREENQVLGDNHEKAADDDSDGDVEERHHEALAAAPRMSFLSQ